METKEKIIEALENNPINTIRQAIGYLENNSNLEVEEIHYKWKVTSLDNDDFKAHFSSDEQLIEWAREERDKIEVAENE